jgi:hypothetical protein
MFTTLVLLTATWAAAPCLQDPPRPADPAAPAPAADAPAAPAQTSEKVRGFLMEAEGKLYDPQAAGLKTLAFDVSLDVPMPGGEAGTTNHLGNVHVEWTANQSPNITVKRDESAKLPPGMPPQMIDQQGQSVAEQLLQTMLNRPISPMLEQFVATMEGAEEGLVKVKMHSDEAAAQGLKEQALYFDDDNRLQKISLVAEQMGMTIKQTMSFNWKPAADGERLILESQDSLADMGMIGKMTSHVAYTYRTIENLTIPTRMQMDNEGAMVGGKSSQVVAATNLVVNGKAAPDEAAPAAPAPPSGG